MAIHICLENDGLSWKKKHMGLVGVPNSWRTHQLVGLSSLKETMARDIF
jgi:hypothetical protein